MAVSINLARILEIPGLPSRAAESIVQFLQVFFICTVTLIPRQPIVVAAAEILTIAVFSSAAQVTAHIRYAKSRSGHPLLWLMIRIVQTQLASIPFFVAGVYLLFGWSAGLYWLVPGFVFSLSLALQMPGSSWSRFYGSPPYFAATVSGVNAIQYESRCLVGGRRNRRAAGGSVRAAD